MIKGIREGAEIDGIWMVAIIPIATARSYRESGMCPRPGRSLEKKTKEEENFKENLSNVKEAGSQAPSGSDSGNRYKWTKEKISAEK